MKIEGSPFLFKGTQLPAAGPGDGEIRTATQPLIFGQGQLVKGEVLGLTPEGKVLLAIGGRTVEARSEVALKPGATFWLEVKQAEPLWLRVADKKGAAQEFLRQYYADPAAMGKGLRAMLALALSAEAENGLLDQAGLLRSFADAAMGSKADPGRIIRLLAMLGSGVTSPDNKPGQAAKEGPANLQELIALLAENREGSLDKSMTMAMQKLGALLELQGELNALPASAQERQFLLFPCFFAMGAGAGQWLFALDREEDQAATGVDRGYTLSFFLEMSRLGELQIQLGVKGRTLQGECVVNTEETREYLAPQLVELEELLVGLGYGPVHFSCRVARSGLLESLKTSLEAAAQLDSIRLVDVKA